MTEPAELLFYGSLRALPLLEAVVGHSIAPSRLQPALIADHRAMVVRGESFTMLVAAKGHQTEAAVFVDVTPDELARITFYEDGDYQLTPVRARMTDGRWRDVSCFLPTARLYPGTMDWSLDVFIHQDLPLAIACAQEMLRFFGHLDRSSVELLWPEIKTRALARLGLRVAHPLDSKMTSAAIVEAQASYGYQGFVQVQDWRIRHQQHRGQVSPVLPRVVLRSGAAATVLPYDPANDLVLIVQQFRIGAFAANDPQPWTIEPIAGRIDPGEDAATTIRREAIEEAGITLKRVEKIGAYYPTPGIADEVLHSYIGEADLTEGEGFHGLAHEGEDIRAITLPFWQAMEAVANGQANTGPLLISLLWLARHRHRLQLDWR